MNNTEPITKEFFQKRIIDLCLRSGLAEFPKDAKARHILFKSAVLLIGQADTFTDKEINQKLEQWLNQVYPIKSIDFITLRRMLVDAGYLTRNKEGSCYQVVSSAPEQGFFEEAIDKIDVIEIINTAREEIIKRKNAFLAKANEK